MNKKTIIALLILIFVFPASALTQADEALDFVRTSVDRVLDILRDPVYKQESLKEAQRIKLRTLTEALFDYDEISKRALGSNRRVFTPEQMKEFSNLFTRFLESIYLDKIQDYAGEKVIYGKTVMLSKNKWEVETEIIDTSEKIFINYRIVFRQGEWRCYDVIIGGVSLVSNYRSQFNKILQKKTPEDLIQQLRDKVNKKENKITDRSIEQEMRSKS